MGTELSGRLGSVAACKFSILCVATRGLITSDRTRKCLMNSQKSMNSSFMTAVSNVSRIGPLYPRCMYPGYGRDRFVASNDCNSNFSVPPGGYPRYNALVSRSNRRVPFRAFLNFGNSGIPSVSLGFDNRCRSGSRHCARRLFNGGGIFGTKAVSAMTRGATLNFIGGFTRRQNLMVRGTRRGHLTVNYANIGEAANRRPNNVIIIPEAGSICSFYPIRRPTGSIGSSGVAARFSFRSVRSAVAGLSRLKRSIPAVCRCLRLCANVPMVGISVDSPRIVSLFASPGTLKIARRSVSSGANAFDLPRYNATFMEKVLVRTRPGAFASLLRVTNLSRNASM